MNKWKHKIHTLWFKLREPYDRWRIKRKNKKKLEKLKGQKNYIYE